LSNQKTAGFAGGSTEVRVTVITIVSIPILLLTIFGAISKRGVSPQTSKVDLLNRQLQELENAPDRGDVGWYVRRAKLTGEKEVILPGFYRCGPELPNIETILTEWDVIVAECKEKYVETHQMGLKTWYKFRIVEDLSPERHRECSTCGDEVGEQPKIPAQLLPLESDEIVVPFIGGQLDIDGVKVVQPQTVPIDFSAGLALERSMPAKEAESSSHKVIVNRQTFLMFLTIKRSSKLGLLDLAEAGVFSCDSAGELTSFDAGSRKLDLAQKRIQSLATLREYQKRFRDRL